MFYFKVVACLYLNSNLFFGRGMQDVSYLAGIEPVPPDVELQSANHWTTREVPSVGF